jgi:enoyl-CoA hydratase/carnithine racemase
MTNAALIEVTIEDSIATIAFNRPEVRNALNDPMREELIAVLDRLGRDATVHAVVLTGNGAGFCAGGDIKAMQERLSAPAGEVAFNGWSRMQRIHQVVMALHGLSKPTIAAVNGPAAGLGADLAICCDFVMAAESAFFTWSYVQRGLIPDGGGMYFLPRRIGLARAKDLIFSARRVSAAEAHSLGIADRVAAPERLLPDARAWARELGANAGPALALAKSIMDKSYESSADHVFSLGSQAQAICYTSREHRDAVTAFMTKSPRG